MRIAVMGAGAVGGYFGIKLAAARHDVTFIARGPHLEAIREQGLQLNSPGGDLRLAACRCAEEPAAVGPVDLVLFCVKSYDTEVCAGAIAPLMHERTVVLSLQNGIDNPDKIARVWGPERTRAGVVYIAAHVPRPGVIEHSAAGSIVLGEFEPVGDERQTRAIAETFSSANVPCQIRPDIRRVQWSKLLWNAPFCAISCITRATVREILSSPLLRDLALDCMAEVREAARTRGIDLAPESMTETLEFSERLGAFRPSMLQDLEAGKPLEHEALNGIVVKLLRERGKSAPVNQVFYAALEFLDQRIRARRSQSRKAI